MKLLFLDVETLGLDPELYDLIEIGALLDVDGQVVDTLDARVKPLRTVYEDEAVRVNGYTPTSWTPNMDGKQAADRLFAMSSTATLVGHNIWFDHSFVARFVRLHLFVNPFSYRMVDTSSLAWPLVLSGSIQNTSLANICRHLQLQNEPMPHRAINGARLAREVYYKLLAGHAGCRFVDDYPSREQAIDLDRKELR